MAPFASCFSSFNFFLSLDIHTKAIYLLIQLLFPFPIYSSIMYKQAFCTNIIGIISSKIHKYKFFHALLTATECLEKIKKNSYFNRLFTNENHLGDVIRVEGNVKMN